MESIHKYNENFKKYKKELFYVSLDDKEKNLQDFHDFIHQSIILNGTNFKNMPRKIKSIGKWRIPRKYEVLSSDDIFQIREEFSLQVLGNIEIPPMLTFKVI